MQAKVSVMLPAANPAAALVLAKLGASTLNVPTDLTLAQLAAIRAAVDLPLDVYVEAPDELGGFVRLHEIPELIRVAAPIYLKFGLRNAPAVYPAGTRSRRRPSRCRVSGCVARRSGWSCSLAPAMKL
jgi:Peptidase family U32